MANQRDTQVEYETMFILRPDLKESDVEEIRTRISAAITGHGGKIVDLSLVGKRRFAYAIHKFREGAYYLCRFYGDGETVRELNRYLSISKENVLRHLTIKVEK